MHLYHAITVRSRPSQWTDSIDLDFNRLNHNSFNIASAFSTNIISLTLRRWSYLSIWQLLDYPINRTDWRSSTVDQGTFDPTVNSDIRRESCAMFTHLIMWFSLSTQVLRVARLVESDAHPKLPLTTSTSPEIPLLYINSPMRYQLLCLCDMILSIDHINPTTPMHSRRILLNLISLTSMDFCVKT